MNLIEDAAAVALRAFAIDGVPASGAHEPGKTELIDVFGVVETRIAGVEAVTTAGIKWTSQSIRVRSTANVVIASALENGDTLNGVTLATGDHVFLGSQTDPAQNGLYTVVASGAAARATFADSAAELAYIGFLVREGTVGAGERWTLPLAAAAITLGATSLTFAPVGIEVSYATEVADASGDYATLPDRLDANDDVVLAVPNVFPGKDLSTAVWYASGTAPAAFRTAEAAARGLATGVADAGAGCYAGAALGESLTDPYAFIRCYIEVGTGEDVDDLPAAVYGNFFSGTFGVYDVTVTMVFSHMIGTRLAVYTYEGLVNTTGAVASVNVGWDATKPNCVLGGIQAVISATPITNIALEDYPAIPSAALPPVLHVTAGRSVSLDIRSVLPEPDGDLDVAWSSVQSSAPYKPWFASGPVVELDPSRVGATIDVRVRQKVGSNIVRWGRSVTIESASASASAATPKILLIGDSLFVRQIAYLLNLDLVARGMTPQWIGTVKGWGAGGSYDGPFGEARGGRRFTDYTGQTSDLSPPPASSGAYLADDNDGRIETMPFLRVATGGDPAEWVFDIGGTDYIFDLDHYLTTYDGTDANRNVDTPDFVFFCLGTNDYLNPGAQGMITGAELGFDILYGQTRDALPSAHIGFVYPALGNGPYDSYRAVSHQVRRSIMAKVAAAVTGGDANVDFLDWGIRQNVEAGWGEATGYTDAIGMKAQKMTDDIHFEGVNRHAAVDVLGSFIRSRV